MAAAQPDELTTWLNESPSPCPDGTTGTRVSTAVCLRPSWASCAWSLVREAAAEPPNSPVGLDEWLQSPAASTRVGPAVATPGPVKTLRGSWDPGHVALGVAEFSERLNERTLEPAGRWVRGSLTSGTWDPGRVALEVANFSDKLGERALEPAGRWVRGSLTAVRDKAHLLGKGSGQHREIFRSAVREAYSTRRRPAGDQEKPHSSSTDSSEEVVAAVPPDRYVTNSTIWSILAGGDTMLVKGSWLLKRSAVVPRRQDLEARYPSALWKVDDLAELVRTGSVAMVAVCHCWCSKEHPDPRGEQMKVIRDTLRQFLNCTPLEDVAVFIDWCSLHQKPRSSEEEAAFSRAMRNIHVWYAHQGIRVWRLTQLPAGAEHAVPYSQRGWPMLEQCLSEMVTKSNFLLDLGQLDSNCSSWGHIIATCTPRRRPPLTPEAFVRELSGKTFSEEADRDVVAKTYTRAFNEVIAAAEELSFNELSWGDQEAQQLAIVLPRCRRLKKLTLYGNRIGEDGGMELVRALSCVEALEEFWVTSNPVTRSKDLKEKLKSAWAETGKSDESLHL